MARPGDIIENPRIGARMVFLQTGRETAGELMEADLFVRPRNKPPPKHIHPFQEERFKVIDGSFTVWTPRREVVLGPGDQYAVPKGTPAHLAQHGSVRSPSSRRGAARWKI